jgi:HEAT repeat protein
MVSARGGSQPATESPDSGLTSPAEPVTADRRSALVAGHTGDAELAIGLSRHEDPSVRVAAVSALEAAGCLTPGIILEALSDPDRWVRRRACELAGRQSLRGAHADLERIVRCLVGLLSDVEPLVAETAAWALGELVPSAAARIRRRAVDPLGDVASGHADPLCREAAVAALGAIGDESSLAIVLDALVDKPPVRRRAVVALAAFDDPRAEEALRLCLTDRDWQVRQAAEDILGRP